MSVVSLGMEFARSVPFSIVNGVKQGGVISPLLFFIYLHKLLGKLAEAGVGCYIRNIFVGALAYVGALASYS